MLKRKLTFLLSNMLCARHLFKLKLLSPQFLGVFTLSSCRNLSSQKQDILKFDMSDEDENDILAREAEIEQKRNKSGLHTQDFNRQHGKPPYDKPMSPHHEMLYYKRRLYGKYGESSQVNPSILWPSKTELAEIKEYMGVVQPFTIQELIKRCEKKKLMEEENRKKAEAKVLEKVKRIPIEIAEFKKRMEQKRLKAEELIEKKNRLILETKKHFDYPIDIRDEKFQIKMAELKEEKRKQIKAKKKAKKMEDLKRMQEKVKSDPNKELSK